MSHFQPTATLDGALLGKLIDPVLPPDLGMQMVLQAACAMPRQVSLSIAVLPQSFLGALLDDPHLHAFVSGRRAGDCCFAVAHVPKIVVDAVSNVGIDGRISNTCCC